VTPAVESRPPPPGWAAAGRWLHHPVPRVNPRVHLVCFAHAGGGPAAFAGWADELPPDIEVVAVRLPGRDNRLNEAPLRQWPALLDAVSGALSAQLTAPVVLFGHSLGGMIAYELTSRLAASGSAPYQLIVAGCRAPHLPSYLPVTYDRPEADFVATLKRVGATPDELLADTRLLRLLTPMLRADLELADVWPVAPPEAVTVPLVVMAGDHDPVAPPEAVAEWSTYARAGFRSHCVPCGHFFVRTAGSGFFDLLRRELAVAAV